MKKLAILMLILTITATVGIPAIYACGGMSILPPDPAMDPDFPTTADGTAAGLDYPTINEDGTLGDNGDLSWDDFDYGSDGTFEDAIL